MSAASARSVVHVVDDDDADLELSARVLLQAGYAVETFRSARAFLSGVRDAQPCCAVLDMRMPGLDGLAVLRALGSHHIAVPIVALTGQADVSVAVEAMKLGAVDFIEKRLLGHALLPAVERAVRVRAEMTSLEAWAEAARQKVIALTPRERDVLYEQVAGRTTKVIARNLGVSPRTVEVFRAKIMHKLDARSLAEVICIALAADPSAGPKASDPPGP